MTNDILAKGNSIYAQLVAIRKVVDLVEMVQHGNIVPSDPTEPSESKHQLAVKLTDGIKYIPVPYEHLKECMKYTHEYYSAILTEYENRFKKL